MLFVRSWLMLRVTRYLVLNYMKQSAYRSQSSSNIVEGVGWEVTIVAIPAFILISFAAYHLYKYLRVKFYGLVRPGVPIPEPHMYREEECPVCLEPISLEVSATCGHVFCSTCIFTMYERQQARIKCPTCRKPITTMFKKFRDSQSVTEQQSKYSTKIKQYNYLYDDNRGILRCLIELPYLWGHIRNSLGNPNFYGYLLRNVWKYRIILLLIIYIISPFDFLPERIMGLIGLLDDFFVFIIIVALIGQASMSFIRRP